MKFSFKLMADSLAKSVCRLVVPVIGAGIMLGASPASESPILVEAEGFDDTGGWVIDPQSMDLMGSPYLLAHGLGVPVEDATTKVTNH